MGKDGARDRVRPRSPEAEEALPLCLHKGRDIVGVRVRVRVILRCTQGWG